jgi:2-methylaconitate cis-trans-isomerase PrpF
VPGTVPHQYAALAPDATGLNHIAIEHPQGKIYVDAKINDKNGEVDVEQATLVRHARRLMAGEVYVPAAIWAGPN